MSGYVEVKHNQHAQRLGAEGNPSHFSRELNFRYFLGLEPRGTGYAKRRGFPNIQKHGKLEYG